MTHGTFSESGGNYVEPDDIGEERARELFQYYRPPEEAKGEAVFLPYPDTVLQAHAQLAACRLDVKRAMIGLLDKEQSYFVAEATKTLDLEDTSQSESVDDGLWYGSISMPKKGGLLEWTVSQEPRYEAGQEIPAHFEVLDLSKDPRWKESQFSDSEPWFRYYCGMPLRTENDINIGAIFVLDDQPRDSTSLTRLKVLYTIAHNIMVHMKTVKESHEKQRAIHMNMCMADFINPEHRFRSRRAHPPKHVNNPKRRAKSRRPSKEESNMVVPTKVSDSGPPAGDDNFEKADGYRSANNSPVPTPDLTPVATPTATVGAADDDDATEIMSLHSTPEKVRGRSKQRDSRSERSTASSVSPKAPEKADKTEADHQRTFDRATYLLRQSLDFSEIGGGGGVVLLDTNAFADSRDPPVRRHSDESAQHGRQRRPNVGGFPTSSDLLTAEGKLAPFSSSNSAYSGSMQERVVLASASVTDGKNAKYFGRADPTWRVTLTPPELQRMCKRHPRGKLYDIPDSVGTSLFDYESRPITSRLSSKFFDLVLLRRQFPEAKQVIFIPMFHASLNRWTSCFAFTNSRYRIFSYEMDYLPLLSFSNAIKAEIVRLATVFADQQKSVFIGSVSHELRSPLHGILASLEFLQDTECDAFQKSCLTTMDACAHTLLDTVSMVLDYNKVNTMRRPASVTSDRSSQSQDSTSQQTMTPTSSSIRNDPLYTTDQDCDVALIVEEVMDGLATGHLARHRLYPGFDDQHSNINLTLTDPASNPTLRRILSAVRPEVELILDISAPSDWTFKTQPGAVRRIVMNLFGNSLKYTKHGSITVSLRASDPEPRQATQVKFRDERPMIVKIVVADTGQGISPEYLRTKVFTPFAQEDKKAAGTGLGLSIVRSIVNTLHGDIDIKSIVNVGTIVTVTLPMRRPSSSAAARKRAASTTATSPDTEITLIAPQPRGKDMDPSLEALLALEYPPQAAIYEPALEHDSFGQSQGAVAVHAALVQYLTGWFRFPVLQTWDFDLPAQILIVDEIHLPTLLAQRPDFLDTVSLQSIIILCANPSRQATLSKDIKSGQVELVCKPFGPYKLARAVLRALEKAEASGSWQRNRPAVAPISETLVIPILERTITDSSFTSSASCATTPGLGPPTPGFGAPTPGSPGLRPTLTPPAKEVSSGSAGGFPFPSRDTDAGPSTAKHAKKPQDRASLLMPPASAGIQSLADREARGESSRTQSALTTLPVSPTLPGMPIRPSKGTITLPIGDAQLGVQTRKPRILLVEDNKVNMNLLHTFVERKGYGQDICKLAEDGQEGVDQFDKFVPDVIFMDISMPVMDGIEATRQIRKLEAKAKKKGETSTTPLSDHEKRKGKRSLIVALTGNAKGSDQAEAMQSGVDMYMTKPVSFKKLGKLLEDWREKE